MFNRFMLRMLLEVKFNGEEDMTIQENKLILMEDFVGNSSG